MKGYGLAQFHDAMGAFQWCLGHANGDCSVMVAWVGAWTYRKDDPEARYQLRSSLRRS